MEIFMSENIIWIELIGFDNTKEDFGLKEYLDKVGFIPDKIMLFLTSLDFINMHENISEESTFAEYYCSYAGHPHNGERARQAWTNFQLYRFIEVIHTYKIKCYLSVLDYICEGHSITEQHPEILAETKDAKIINSIYMIKRFADGTYYEDFFLEKLLKVLNDYHFDGFHIADGVSSPRLQLQFGDFSKDIVDQSGIKVPEGQEPIVYITKHKYAEWVSFMARRWSLFLTKIINGLKKESFESIVNSTWTKDPMEAMFRYGIDYSKIKEITSFAVENVVTCLALLDYEACAGYHQSYERRRFIHYEFLASLMLIKTVMRETPITPLLTLRDTKEQFDVIHCLPSSIERILAVNYNNFIIDKNGLSPVVSGQVCCLGDSMSADEWNNIGKYIKNSHTDNVKDVTGATVIWSTARNYNEIAAFIEHRTYSSAKWLAELLSRGAFIHKAVNIEDIDSVNGDIVVINPSLLPDNEIKKIKGYNRGRTIYVSAPDDSESYKGEINPVNPGYPYPLTFAEVSEDLIKNYVSEINSLIPVSSDRCCNVTEVVTGPDSSRFLIENDEYHYVKTTITTGRKIKSAHAVTKLEGYNVFISDDAFRILVPLKGIDIVDVKFL